MVDHGAIRAQLFDKNLITQPLRSPQIAGILGQPQDKGIRCHMRRTLFQSQMSYRAMRPKGEGFATRLLTATALLKNPKSGQCGEYPEPPYLYAQN